MRTLRIVGGAVILILATAAPSRAEGEETDLSIQTEFGQIVRSDSWLGRQVFGQRGKLVGVAKDLALDLETGHLALVLVKLSGLDEKSQGYLAVPPAAIEISEKGLQLKQNVEDSRLANARRLPESAYHRQLNRGWAEQQFNLFQRQPYWVREVKVQGKDSSKQPIDNNSHKKHYMLTLASKLNGIQINDKDGTSIGTVKGFAVVPGDGRIVYAAVKLSEDDAKLYPVPLGAFVVDQPEQPWSVELARETVADTPGFTADNWPDQVERGWIEYVHVRYGRAAIGGVQHKTGSN